MTGHRMFAVGVCAGFCIVALWRGLRIEDESSVLASAVSTAQRRGAVALARAFHDVLDSCQVDAWGIAHTPTCRDPLVVVGLARTERAVGVETSLLSYCEAIRLGTRPAAAASARIERLARNPSELRDAATTPIYDCLEQALGRESRPLVAERLARAFAMVGTALERERDVVELAHRLAPARARVAIYESLWANGRLRALPVLERLWAGEGSIDVKRAAIHGLSLGTPLTEQESAAICAAVVPVMASGDPAAGAAAVFVAEACAGDRRALVAAAKARLERSAVDVEFVAALARATRSESGEVGAVARSLLTEVGRDRGLDPLTRAAAAQSLADLVTEQASAAR